jgi:coenzyme F420 hydrogenase subunit beta
MNIPPPPADMLILQTDDGRIDIPLSEVKPLIPHTCFICPDMTSEWSDVSVGMFEGRPGWNTLIVRSEEGANLIEKACEAGYLQTEKIPEKYLSNLCKAAGAIRKKEVA